MIGYQNTPVGKRKVQINYIKRNNYKLKKAKLNKPSNLSPVEEQVWDYVAKKFTDNYILDDCDEFSLKLFCSCVEEYLLLKKQLEVEGFSYEDENGKKHVNPLYQPYHQAFIRLMRFVNEFGLTPKSRKKFIVARKNSAAEEIEKELKEQNLVHDDLEQLMESYEQPLVESR